MYKVKWKIYLSNTVEDMFVCHSLCSPSLCVTLNVLAVGYFYVDKMMYLSKRLLFILLFILAEGLNNEQSLCHPLSKHNQNVYSTEQPKRTCNRESF